MEAIFEKKIIPQKMKIKIVFNSPKLGHMHFNNLGYPIIQGWPDIFAHKLALLENYYLT